MNREQGVQSSGGQQIWAPPEQGRRRSSRREGVSSPALGRAAARSCPTGRSATMLT
uniref:Uncharacterized protein n=1 Tax=Arundo donax TaxID=35708 RepID=A0A0A9A2H6_ARUDO